MSFRNVVYRYGNNSNNVLNGITADISRGEFVAVIGPNGSGKSTLARHINGLLVPSEGQVTVDGMDTREPESIPEIRRRVGFVFQNPDNQLVGTTVEEDIAFGPENTGTSPEDIRESVDFAMTVAGLRELAGRPPHMLSGGQKQQLAIAGVVAMKTGCLVLDEPTSMIGPAGRRSVMGLLSRLKEEFNMTLVLITHHMEEAVFADRVMVTVEGHIAAEGTPREVFRSTSALYGMGLELPGPVELSNRLRALGLTLPDPVLTVDELVSCLCLL
ncbi:MAG TPA: energy-coupling factor transporter ATPase [Desulfotomaculum sp.]|nr:energy-coupling factor transporter ATPase [Desulfotomaculum sp.]